MIFKWVLWAPVLGKKRRKQVKHRSRGEQRGGNSQGPARWLSRYRSLAPRLIIWVLYGEGTDSTELPSNLHMNVLLNKQTSKQTKANVTTTSTTKNIKIKK